MAIELDVGGRILIRHCVVVGLLPNDTTKINTNINSEIKSFCAPAAAGAQKLLMLMLQWQLQLQHAPNTPLWRIKIRPPTAVAISKPVRAPGPVKAGTATTG